VSHGPGNPYCDDPACDGCRLRRSLKRAPRKGHGTRSRYVYGCRCAFCKQANSDYGRERKREAAGVHIATARLLGIPEVNPSPNADLTVRDARPYVAVVRAVAAHLNREPLEMLLACGVYRTAAVRLLKGDYQHVSEQVATAIASLTRLLPSETEGAA
jgi:hypothetical protein